MDRPMSVSLISTIAVITGLFVLASIAGNAFFYKTDWSYAFYGAVIGLIVEALLYLICGMFIFTGQNWARLVLIAWLFFGLGYKFMHDPLAIGFVLSISTWMLILLLSTICLFGDEANDYYA